MTTFAYCDFETRSPTNIRDGLARYFSDPGCDAMMLAYKLPGQDEVKQWHRGPHLTDDAPPPQDLFDFIAAGGMISAWNCQFEFLCWNMVCVPKYGWPPLPIEQCHDTMAQAAAHNLPQSLEKCGDALGLDPEFVKNKRGKYLIGRLSVPHAPTIKRPGIWVEDADLFEEYLLYNRQDVVAEEAIAKKLRPLTELQQRRWVLTQRVNQRGVPVAVDEIVNISRVVEAEKERLNAELRTLTQYEVTAASKRNDLLRWVNARLSGEKVEFYDPSDYDEDNELDDLKGKTVDAALKRDDLPPGVRRALEIRAAVVQTSTAKYDKMLKVAADDGTLKGMYVYHGASTGRYASKGGINVQNFARPSLSDLDIVTAHDVLGSGDHAAAVLLWGDQVMDAAVSCLRGAIKAPDGYEFINADFSSVENRVGVWLADQYDKVEMFAKGFDEYKVFASAALYNVPYDAVTKAMRQMSKSAVLGCFGAETPVLTDSGWKQMVDVTTDDLVHDGVEFVRHGGVVYQGMKQVINFAGVWVTPDHQILGEQGWQAVESIQYPKSAVATATGLLSATSLSMENWLRPRGARAARRALFRSTSFDGGRRRAAWRAETRSFKPSSEPRQASPTSFPTRRCASDGSIVDWLRSLAAQTRRILATRATAAAASTSIPSGAPTPPRFFDGWSRSRGGMTAGWNWTAATTTRGTAPTTAGLQLAPSRTATSAPTSMWSGMAAACAQRISGACTRLDTAAPARSAGSSVKGGRPARSFSASCSVVAPTYDVLNAGPRSRFVVLTDKGPVIAHNCLYGQGAKGLIEYAKGYGVELTLERSTEVVKLYRQEYKKVRDLWYDCGDASIAAVKSPGTWFDAGTKLQMICHRNFLWMRLPSGRLLAWARPKVEMREAPWLEKHLVGYDESGDAVYQERPAMREVVTVESVETKTRQWCRHPLIGSSIFQSATQGAAADVLGDGMENVEAAGYPIVMTTHDELMAQVREGWGSVEEFGSLMCRPAAWREDLPLAYEGYRSRRYKK